MVIRAFSKCQERVRLWTRFINKVTVSAFMAFVSVLTTVPFQGGLRKPLQLEEECVLTKTNRYLWTPVRHTFGHKPDHFRVSVVYRYHPECYQEFFRGEGIWALESAVEPGSRAQSVLNKLKSRKKKDIPADTSLVHLLGGVPELSKLLCKHQLVFPLALHFEGRPTYGISISTTGEVPQVERAATVLGQYLAAMLYGVVVDFDKRGYGFVNNKPAELMPADGDKPIDLLERAVKDLQWETVRLTK